MTSDPYRIDSKLKFNKRTILILRLINIDVELKFTFPCLNSQLSKFMENFPLHNKLF